MLPKFLILIFCHLLSTTNSAEADTSQLESECCYGQSLVYRKYVEFVGKSSETLNGNHCMNWDSASHQGRKQMWLSAKFTLKRNYLSRQTNNNYCRSLRKGKKPGCYISPNKWEYCDVPRCSETLLDSTGIYYKGKRNHVGGENEIPAESCLSWNTTSELRLRNTKHNFCRNPDSDPRGPWCSTENSSKSYCTSLSICKMRVAKLVDTKLTVLPDKVKNRLKLQKRKNPSKNPKTTTKKPKTSIKPKPTRKISKPAETWEPPCGKVCKCGMRCAGDQDINTCAFVKNDGQVERGEEPWHVAIINRATKQLICSGSILNRRHILTAASCVTAFKNALVEKANRINKNQILVATGFHKRGPFTGNIPAVNASYGQGFHRVGKILTHKKYRRELKKSSSKTPVLLNNAAILRLKGNGIHYHHSIKTEQRLDPVTGFSLTRPICLPSKSFMKDAVIEDRSNSINATICKITSYGQSEDSSLNKFAKYLMGVSSKILNKHDCIETLRRVPDSPFYGQTKRKLPPSYFCSKSSPKLRSLHETAGTCTGELGSPLTTMNGAVVQLGIGNWNLGCQTDRVPGLFTKVPTLLTWIRRKSQDVQIREPQHVKPHTTTMVIPITTTSTTTTPKPTTTNPPTTTSTTESNVPTKAPTSPITQATAVLTTDSITNYVQPQTEPPSNPNKQTLAMISDASTVIDFYEVLPTNKLSLIKQLQVPYAMTKPQSRPFIIYNPEFQAIEIMGDVHDHKNTEHGWIDINSGRYTRSNYNRFEGREQFAGVWTEKLGMLIFGGHKNKAKWRKPLERYSTCVLQVTYPRNMYTDWKYMPNLKTGRTLSAAVHHEDRVYVSGGRDSAYALESIEMMDLQRYTKGGETKRKLIWQVLRPMNQAAKQHSLFVFNDILFSAIGERDRRTVEGYDMNRQNTISESALSLYNHVSGAAFVNAHTNSLMLVAGGGTADYVEISEYDESSKTWSEFDFMYDPGLMKKQNSRPFLSWTHFTHNYA